MLNATNPRTGLWDGHYRNGSGSIMRYYRVQFDTKEPPTYRLHELYEFYPEEVAQAMVDNDASFLVEGSLSPSNKVDTYRFTSHTNQLISIIVLPVISKIGDTKAEFSDFDMALARVDKAGQARYFVGTGLQSSRKLTDPPIGYQDYIVIRGHPGEVFEVAVIAKVLSPVEPNYRVYVTGSGFYEGLHSQEVDKFTFNHWNIFGSYQHFNKTRTS